MMYKFFSPFLCCLSETAKSESFDLNHLSSLLCQIFLGGGPCVSCDILNAAFDDHKPTYQSRQHCGEISFKVGNGIHEPGGGGGVTTTASSNFCSMNHLGVLLVPPPPGQDVSLLQGYPQQYITNTHSYTWVKRDMVE